MVSEKRTKVKIGLSASERSILETKMRRYGYKHISTYVRDACIYENIIAENMEGKQEVIKAVATLLELAGNISVDLKVLLTHGGLDKDSIHKLNQQNIQLLEEMEELKRLIIEKMKITYEKQNMRNKIKQECLNLEEV